MTSRPLRWIAGCLALALTTVIVLVVQRVERPEANFDARIEVERALDSLPPEKLAEPELAAPGAAPSDTLSVSTRKSVEPARKALAVHVVEPSGESIAGANLALFHAGEVIDSGASDRSGVVHFEPREGTAEYALLAPGWALARGVLELGPGERTLTLEGGETIAGSVLVDGAPPVPPMTLDFDEGIPALPTEVFNALGGARQGYLRLAARTRTDGSFAFHGLPADTTGTIRWKEPFFLEQLTRKAPQQRSVSATAPQRDLNLRLIAGVEVRLRVVDLANEPVPGAPVAVSGGPNGFADFDGRYVGALLPPEDRKGTIEVALVGGAGARKHPVEYPASGVGVLELGDLSTNRTHPLTVIVQAAHHDPIGGARIWPELAERWYDGETDQRGIMVLAFGDDERAFYVDAEGYVRARFEVPEGASEIVATLEKKTLLEVEVAGVTSAQKELLVEVTRDAAAWQAAMDAQPATRSRWNTSPLQTIGSGPDEDGRWRIAGVAARESLRLVLRRSGGPELDALDVEPLAPGEHRFVQMRMPQGGRSFRVRMLSPDGAPLLGARVEVTNFANGGSRESYAADEQGEVELESMFGERFTLVAHAEGFPSKPVLLTAFPTTRVDIVLEPAHSVEVELVWPDGRSFEAPAQVSALVGRRFERAIPLRAGLYRIDHLPGREVRLWISAASFTASPLHDARVPRVLVSIGHVGSVTARMKPPTTSAPKLWSVALALPGSASDLTRTDIGALGPGDMQATLNGIAFGTYDAWLEQADMDGLERWARVGTPIPVVLDAQHPLVNIEPHP
ncbi:MAG TPA: carboxypeptidase-like regulatory domain-containing protein [Planctomycetota bacterium]|nr:carboxypeptidase-like regulatory domain-containing protein [Planctomycetota bacterium]